MRVCVLPFIAALAIPAFAAPVLPSTPDSGVIAAQVPVFTSTNHSMLSVTPSTAADLDRLTDGEQAARPLSYWTTIDLEMLVLRDRIEASPLLREGLASASDITTVLALN